MNIKEKVNYSFQVNNILSSLIKRDIDSFDKNQKVVFSYLTIIMQYHKSITKLVDEDTLSALYMIRPLHEAYIKLIWLITFYETSKVDKVILNIYKEDGSDSFPSIDSMVNQLEIEFNSVNNLKNDNIIFDNLRKNRKLFTSNAHVNSYLVSLILNKKDKFKDEDKLVILSEMTLYLLLSFNAYAFITKDMTIAKKLDYELNKSHV